MPLTVSTLIDDAELLAYPYVPHPAPPRPALARVLGSLDAEIVRLLLAEAPHVLSAPAAASLTIVRANNAAGYALDSGYQHQAFEYVDTDGRHTPITIVPLGRLDDGSAEHPAAVIVNQTTFLPVDPFGKRWAGNEARSWYPGDGETVTYRVGSSPKVVTALTDTLNSPDSARDYFLWSLRLYIMLLQRDTPDTVIAAAKENVTAERALFLQQAHKAARITSRFGEQRIGGGQSRLEIL